MPKLTRIYTRTGDQGTTRLGNNQQVPKNHPRVVAFGTVDELNAQIGVILSFTPQQLTRETLSLSQHLLFHIGTTLSFPPYPDKPLALPEITQAHVQALEAGIDSINQLTGNLENFILPGGCPTAAALHVARTICRRAEREVVTLMETEPIPELALTYLNRLSDALFVLARYENLQNNFPEPLWDSHA